MSIKILSIRVRVVTNAMHTDIPQYLNMMDRNGNQSIDRQ